MQSAELSAGALQVRLARNGDGLHAIVACGDERHAMRCSADNLVMVLRGLRYHLAGGNGLTTISRREECVEIDHQCGAGDRRTGRVSVAEYVQALESLGISDSFERAA